MSSVTSVYGAVNQQEYPAAKSDILSELQEVISSIYVDAKAKEIAEKALMSQPQKNITKMESDLKEIYLGQASPSHIQEGEELQFAPVVVTCQDLGPYRRRAEMQKALAARHTELSKLL